jgi:hypothetical protein
MTKLSTYLPNIKNWRCYKVGRLVIANVSGSFNATPIGYEDLVSGLPLSVRTMVIPVSTNSGNIIALEVGTDGIIRKASNSPTSEGYYSGVLVYPTNS